MENYALLDDKQKNKVFLSVQVLDLTRFSMWMYNLKCQQNVLDLMAKRTFTIFKFFCL
jgi:hypothetical protein